MPEELRREGEVERMSEAELLHKIIDACEGHDASVCSSVLLKARKLLFVRDKEERFSRTKGKTGRPPLDSSIVEKIAALVSEGHSARVIGERIGVHRNTVGEVKRKLSIEGFCRCGREKGHRGWCKYKTTDSWSEKLSLVQRDMVRRLPSGYFFYLGFMAFGSAHREELPKMRRCESRSCPFPALFFDDKGMHVCRYHLRFFYYKLSMTDSRLGWEDTHDSEDQTAPISVVEPWDNNFIFELKGTRKYERSTLEELTV